MVLSTRRNKGILPAQVAKADRLLGDGFLGWERQADAAWSWSRGDAAVTLYSSNPETHQVRVTFELGSLVARQVRVRAGDRLVAEVQLVPGQQQGVAFDLELPQGRTQLQLLTDAAAVVPGNGDPRSLAFSIRGVRLSAGPASSCQN